MNNTESKYLINQSKKILLFTGAGVSKESGIPTFRDDDGIWKNYNPLFWGTKTGLFTNFTFNIKKFAEFFIAITEPIISAKPNLAHYAIRDLQENKEVLILTQNIDNLHQEAGSKNVEEIHGNLLEIIQKSGVTKKISKSQFADYLEKIKQSKSQKELKQAFLPILSFAQGIRPNVVLFNEGINRSSYDKASKFINSCDCLIIVGTSLNVYPAANIASAIDKKKIINIGYDTIDGAFNLNGNAREILPLLIS